MKDEKFYIVGGIMLVTAVAVAALSKKAKATAPTVDLSNQLNQLRNLQGNLNTQLTTAKTTTENQSTPIQSTNVNFKYRVGNVIRANKVDTPLYFNAVANSPVYKLLPKDTLLYDIKTRATNQYYITDGVPRNSINFYEIEWLDKNGRNRFFVNENDVVITYKNPNTEMFDGEQSDEDRLKIA